MLAFLVNLNSHLSSPPEFALLEIGGFLSLLPRKVVRTDNYVRNASSLNFSKQTKSGKNTVRKGLTVHFI